MKTPNLVIPFFPLQIGEMTRIFRKMVHKMSLSFEGIMWKRLDVLESVVRHFTGPNTVRYIQTKKSNIVFSERGGHDIIENPFMYILKEQMDNGFFSRPDFIALCDYDIQTDEVMFSWCNPSIYEHSLDTRNLCKDEIRIKSLGKVYIES